MKLSIENLLAYEHHEVEVLPGVTVIAGKNASGKSSLALILAALVANEPNPGGLSAAQRKAYIREGRHEGHARLENGEAVLTWDPANGSIVRPDPDIPVFAAPEAVGLVDFIAKRGTPKDRADLWASLFESPTDPEILLREQWGARAAAPLNAVLKTIKAGGWDAALALMEEKRREAKAQWAVVTKERAYGDRKAVSWTPDHWDATLATASEAELQAELTNARDDLTSISSEAAVEAADIERARAAQRKLHATRRELREATARRAEAPDMADMKTKLMEAQEYLADRKAVQVVSAHDVAKGMQARKRQRELGEEREKMVEERNRMAGEADKLSRRGQDIKATMKLDEGYLHAAKNIILAEPEHRCPGCQMALVMRDGSLFGWLAPGDRDRADAEQTINDYPELARNRRAELEQARTDWEALSKGAKALDDAIAQATAQMHALEEDAKLADLKPTIDADEIRGQIEATENCIESLMQAVQEAADAHGAVAQLEGREAVLVEESALADAEPTEIDADARAAAETAVQQAERRLEAWRAMADAKRAHNNVVEYDHLCRLLAPDGVRRGGADRITEVREKIMHLFSVISSQTGWPGMKLTPTYELLVNGRPIGVPMAESEKLRAQWAVQIVFAVMSNSKWIILDRCDTLKDESWTGLLHFAEYWQKKNPKTHFVMCATTPPSIPGGARVVSSEPEGAQ